MYFHKHVDAYTTRRQLKRQVKTYTLYIQKQYSLANANGNLLRIFAVYTMMLGVISKIPMFVKMSTYFMEIEPKLNLTDHVNLQT